MPEKIIEHNNTTILYDTEDFDQLDMSWFDGSFWEKQSLTKKPRGGRGKAWIVSFNEDKFVLRHYCRGGLYARINHDRYLWRSLVKSRPWREWHTLSFLYKRGLPVPKPLAMKVSRQACWYRGDIITRYIPNSCSLADWIIERPLDNTAWAEIGKTIKQLHDAEVLHADLNAHNILIDEQQKIYLIDFDKADRIKATTKVYSNLDRLHRSLIKLQSIHPTFHFSEQQWQCLIDAY